MAPLKIALQVSCPNCQAANLPGSPYCSRCGASLEGLSAAAPHSGPSLPTRSTTDDPMRRFTMEGQDPVLVHQAYERASDILTSGETLEYVAVAHRGSLTHAPDCAVATNKRIILYRKKVLGKLEQDDFYWRDVRIAAMKDGRNGVTLTLESIQGWQMAVESLPKSQAWRLYELAVEHSEKLAEALRASSSFDPNFAPDFTMPAVEGTSPAAYYASSAPQSPQASPLSVRPSVPSLPTAQAQAPYTDVPSVPAPEVSQPQPTPQSVLQAILQQAAGNGGAPTRPMPLSAAAFTAPVADAQPVTFSEATTDLNMRSMPRLNSLEEIAVFSGPLTAGLFGLDDSAPPSPYEQRSVEPTGGPAPTASNGGAERKAEARERSPFEPPAAQSVNRSYDASYPDGPMPLPGSLSSGPLLEAAFDNGAHPYASDLISGSLETQQLDAHRAADLTDRITSTNLAPIHDDLAQTVGRSRRTGNLTRPVQSAAQKPRPGVGTPSGRPNARAEADDPVQKMKQLKTMLDAGLIDNEDYEAKKAEILSRL